MIKLYDNTDLTLKFSLINNINYNFLDKSDVNYFFLHRVISDVEYILL